MIKKIPFFEWKIVKGSIDWTLLLFLFLFLDVKVIVKIFAIILVYLLQFNFAFGFKLKSSRLPLFYPLIILIAIAGFLVNGNNTQLTYLIVFFTGLLFWLVCILAIHQVRLFVERNEVATIHRTLLIFFIVNAFVSFLNLAVIVWHTEAFNPYLYQGEYQKYFVNTGDFVKGLTFDNSTTNAVLNAFGVIYFLTRKQVLMALACMAVLILAGSNFTNIILLTILTGIFIFNSDRDQKSVIIICLMLVITFIGKVSPQNSDYVLNTVRSVIYRRRIVSPWPVAEIPMTLRPDSTLTPQQKKQKFAMLHLDSIKKAIGDVKKIPDVNVPAKLVTNDGRILLPTADLNAPVYQYLRVTPPEQKQLLQFEDQHKKVMPAIIVPHLVTIPGKVIGFLQTFNFLKGHPTKILTGDGIGNFSSKLAFRTTGLKFTGGYPSRYIYICHDFLVNHLDIYITFFSRDPSYHSLTNSPFAVYDQMLAEYGLLGLLALFAFYLWFFAKNYHLLTYGIPLLVFLAAVFFIDYWFEQLSIVVMFELLLFLNIKENKELAAA